nr:Jag N-terminal domain-containing protein [Anoxybacillus flavithermus]
MRGQTVEEAVDKALAQLHLSKEAVDIVVVQQEKSRFLVCSVDKKQSWRL